MARPGRTEFLNRSPSGWKLSEDDAAQMEQGAGAARVRRVEQGRVVPGDHPDGPRGTTPSALWLSPAGRVRRRGPRPPNLSPRPLHGSPRLLHRSPRLLHRSPRLLHRSPNSLRPSPNPPRGSPNPLRRSADPRRRTAYGQHRSANAQHQSANGQHQSANGQHRSAASRPGAGTLKRQRRSRNLSHRRRRLRRQVAPASECPHPADARDYQTGTCAVCGAILWD